MSTEQPSQIENAAADDTAKLRGRRQLTRKNTRPPDPGDERRQRRPNERSSTNGFGDAMDRALCLAMEKPPPPTGVLFARSGVTTLIPTTVARSASAILFCDGQHEGPHIWPNGEVAGDEPRTHAPTLEAQSGDTSTSPQSSTEIAG